MMMIRSSPAGNIRREREKKGGERFLGVGVWHGNKILGWLSDPTFA